MQVYIISTRDRIWYVNYCVSSWNKVLLEHYRYGWNITDKCVPVYIKEPADSAYLRKLLLYVILRKLT